MRALDVVALNWTDSPALRLMLPVDVRLYTCQVSPSLLHDSDTAGGAPTFCRPTSAPSGPAVNVSGSLPSMS